MYLSMSRIVVISLLVFLLSGCPSVDQVIDEMITAPVPAPTRPLYVLASTAPLLNELDIVDADTWQVVRRAPLPMDSFWAFRPRPIGAHLDGL